MTPYSAVEPSGGMSTKLQIMLSLDLDKQVTNRGIQNYDFPGVYELGALPFSNSILRKDRS